MLTEEQNKQLTQVSLGTPMGELLRRYWHPVAAVEELEERPTRPVRIFGEELVLFKCGDDAYGLIDRYCAHRLTDLAYGIVEDCTLRCPRHGWAYSDTGVCVDQPMEEELVEVKLNAYKATAKAGMVWVYIGPEPAPLVPDWEPFHRQEGGLVQVVMSVLHCNWLQCQENTMDGIDMELFTAAFEEAMRTGQPPPLPDAEFEYDEFEHGYLVRNTSSEAPSVTKTSIWPNALFAGDARSSRLEWRVPMDDETTLILTWFLDRPPATRKLDLPEKTPYWYAQTRGRQGRGDQDAPLEPEVRDLAQSITDRRSHEGSADGGRRGRHRLPQQALQPDAADRRRRRPEGPDLRPGPEPAPAPAVHGAGDAVRAPRRGAFAGLSLACRPARGSRGGLPEGRRRPGTSPRRPTDC